MSSAALILVLSFVAMSTAAGLGGEGAADRAVAAPAHSVLPRPQPAAVGW